jgi:hypothetical protein
VEAFERFEIFKQFRDRITTGSFRALSSGIASMIKSKVAGSVNKGKVDRLLTPELADGAARARMMHFIEAMDQAILSANRDVISHQIPVLSRESLLRLIVRVAELRADYVQCGLRISEHRHPDSKLVDELAESRRAYEELLAVYTATERAIERGYLSISD